MVDRGPYVCSLDARDLDGRVEQVDALSHGLLGRERTGQQVRLRSPADLAPLVRAFVRDESRCCSFLA